MKKEHTCCFTGHRSIPLNQYSKIHNILEKVVIRLIDSGVCYFGTGGALGFDTMAALTILNLKEKYPNIKLILVLPCKNQTYNWSIKDKQLYDFIKSKCDKYVYTSKQHYNGCMIKRNRHLVNNSKYCICYLTKKSGGTAYTVNYAKSNGLLIYNVAEEING